MVGFALVSEEFMQRSSPMVACISFFFPKLLFTVGFSCVGDDSRRNKLWKPEMDKCLLDVLLKEGIDGHRVPNGFKDTAYTAVAREVNFKFNESRSKDNVLNRVKTLKKDYKAIHGLLKKSGFGWNNITKRIEVIEEVWEPFLAVHSEMKRYKDKSWPLYELMAEVFGEEHAIGQFTDTSREMRQRRNNESATSEETVLPYRPTFDGFGVDDINPSMTYDNTVDDQSPGLQTQGQPNTKQVEPIVGSSSGKPQPCDRKHGRDAFNNVLLSMVDKIGDVATAIRDHPTDYISPSCLLNAVEGVDGIEQAGMDFVFEYLLKNPSDAKAFMTYDVNGRRRMMWRILSTGCQ